ncbi:MAG: protein-L-isoaspartate O-methyltransferase [archaeon]|nr:protein-L-isoaspartate O-methyltransferase [archaeon]
MESLLKGLKEGGALSSEIVYKAMLKTDRKDFIDHNPYEDSPQYISHNATISAPHMHAFAMEYLKDFIKEGSRVLDIGSGSGYLTVAFSKMMNDKGIVVGVEHIKELFSYGLSNISKHNKELIDEKKIILSNSDGRKGYSELSPYNAIHVGAAAEIIPEDLINQLANGGRMFIPVGPQNGNQSIVIVDKDLNGKVKQKSVMGVSYVPLTSVELQVGKCY